MRSKETILNTIMRENLWMDISMELEDFMNHLDRIIMDTGNTISQVIKFIMKVGRVVYYNADEHNYKICDLNEMTEYKEIDFYEIFRTKI